MKNKLNSIFYISLFLTVVVLTYKNWFLHSAIIGGDWPFFFQEKLNEATVIPTTWNSVLANGFGAMSPFYSLQFFHQFTISLSNFLHIPWVIVYKITWFGLFIFLSVLSSLYFIKTALIHSNLVQRLIGAIIFSTNTYVLMMVGGGQMGVALAYSLSPLVLAISIKLIDFFRQKKQNLKLSLVTGLVLAVQVMFDPRIAYITLIAVGIYILFSFKKDIQYFRYIGIYVIIIPVVIVVSLHASWILPTIVFHYNPASEAGSTITSPSAFKFFSFADLSHSLSLLHPNWPENIFGKVYFLYPEFLILPTIAFLSLLFASKYKKILFFSAIGLIGVFLAKGANEPLGQINSWMFLHVPGFILFRDSTKFYLLIILSYVILIPFALGQISKVSLRFRKLSLVAYLGFIVLWMFMIRPALTGKLSGTFQNNIVPTEYFVLERFLANQPDFFRTLWVPREQRFSFVSDQHPGVEAGPLFGATNSAQLSAFLKSDKVRDYLQRLGIKYVIVPYDSMGEIFINNRKYDNQQYQKTINDLRSILWLHEIKGFGKIVVFALNNNQHHFWLLGNGRIAEKMVEPDEYQVKIFSPEVSNVIFAESYSPYWIAKVDNKEISSQKTSDGFNYFSINKAGNYKVLVYFSEKLWFRYGWIISGICLLILVFLLLFTFA